LRLIKKYPNRKFYDTEDKRYISLSGIAALIARGEDVQVVDNQTGRDISSVVLSQILRQQQRRGALVPPALLTALVRSGSVGIEHLSGSFRSSLEAVRLLEDEVLDRIDSLTERGEIGVEEALEWREELLSRARERQSAAEERILQQIQGSLERVGVPGQQDLRRLNHRLAEIEAKVDSLVAGS
jgi:polyhydroxyalkanoate synthesis repressor PhaR